MSMVAVFIPGIMGSELQLPSGEIVWPPKVSETILGYKRIGKLQDPAAKPTRIIANVSCVDFYAPILSLFAQIGFGSAGSRRLVEHPYDWRRDLFDLAEDLAASLDEIDAEEIVLVAHSMGGLIARLLLETPTWRDKQWFPKVSAFFALATPHNGAPLALARILGLDSAMGISAADFKRLSENSAYPSGYQLLPAPGEAAVWDIRSASGLAHLDFYDDAVARQLGMRPELVARTRALHEAYRTGEPPDHVRYFYFCGTGHKTVTRINVGPAGPQKVETPDAGDGTVPLWSALPRTVQKQVVVNDHTGVFRGVPFKRVFFRLMGGDAGPPTEMIDEEAFQISVSLQRPVFVEGEAIEAVLSVETRIETLEGRLVFYRINDVADASEMAVSIPIGYSGPGIATLALTIDSRLTPGSYELRFEGDRQQSERAIFAVCRHN